MISLDRTSFDSCLNSNRHSQLVQNDLQLARDLRLTGTPTFVTAYSDGSEPQALVGHSQPTHSGKFLMINLQILKIDA
jgi:predicted DsbA family dithiol-disulfide isomerase